MKRSIHTLVATVLCGIAFSVAAAPHAFAQGQAKVILSARAEGNAEALVLVDTAQGTRIDEKATGSFAQLMTGTEWSILDNGQLLITKDGKSILATGYLANQKQTFFLLHAKTAKLSVNGTLYRSSQDQSRGFAEMFVEMTSNDGQSTATVYLFVPLTFAASQPGGDGGFGGFGG